MKVLKSFLLANPQFDLHVAEHAERLRHWRAHMERVDADEADETIAPIARHAPYDRPRAPDIIEAAIDEDFQPSYEIEDDSAGILAEKKNRLLNLVVELEQAAIAAIVPAGKVRLLNLREAKIGAADGERMKLLADRRSKPGFLKKMIGGKEEFDVAAAVREQRPAEDTLHLQEQQQRRDRRAAIEEIAAQAMHDIEDLTADTIGQWQAPDFSGV